ncbi:MAG TPA: tRNA1(Val) (adenine(37)-N6)-methyltransferase [Clostridiaceae bacterium]|jgi:tRNA1Val (adenine37-N6)-methyltransferase|nr:tRNA1(Val) (adenine(37)-N6)-methyltransferase [Clostridiaceae bacterium]
MLIHLNENETVDDLQYKGLTLIQKKDGFRFGIDAVLLANFADVKKGDIVLDIGTGTGIISILLAGKTEAKTIYGLEIQKEVAEMAGRSVILNNLQDRVKIVHGNIKNGLDYFRPSSFNVVITNPPYIPYGRGLVNYSDSKAISRHEISCNLENIISTGSKLLVPGGQLAMIHRPERLVDVLFLMRTYSIEPKYIRFVHPSSHKKANLFLIKGTRGGNPELKMMDPLYIYDSQGKYSEEINKIYNRS